MVLVRRGTILVRSGNLIPGSTLGQGQWTGMEQVITMQPDITMDMGQRTARDMVRIMDQLVKEVQKVSQVGYYRDVISSWVVSRGLWK